MLLLALDTATPAGSAALLSDDHLLASRYFDTGLHHSERLFVEIDGMLRAAGCEAAEIEVVAVTIGPGSFTGLRIGLSAAKGFCLARDDRELVTVPTLEVLAGRLPYCQRPVCAMLDARRSEVYAGLYDTTCGLPRAVAGPVAAAPEQIVAEWHLDEAVFTGDGATRYADLVAGCPGAVVAPPSCNRPDAATTGWLGLERYRAGAAADVAAVEPEYLRNPAYRRAASS
ncbi:tRNA (adenosine(37)-N6)-threonylcarbamoyltransferase complex dimerization subunit type 1 TsaB [Candidatus Latescibacterota bacterium]